MFKAVGEHAPRGTVKLNIQPVAVQADLLHMKLFTAQQQGIYVCVQPAFAHLTHGVPLLPLRVTHALQGKGQRTITTSAKGSTQESMAVPPYFTDASSPRANSSR